MSPNEIITLYLSTLAGLGGLASYFINHLMKQIARLEDRVDEIYRMLMEK